MGLLKVAQGILNESKRSNIKHIKKNIRKKHHKLKHSIPAIHEEKTETGYPLPDVKLLPSSKFLYLGHIADTNIKTYLDPEQLLKHVLVAGGTGSGKTVSGMVIIEELLKRDGISVIIFDPVGQWTGFLKENDDKMMLSLYEKFEMDAPKSFHGEILEINEETINIDILHYVNKKGLTILKLDKLDPHLADNFIELALERIHRAHLRERKTLKSVLVLDEVHRLLPEFGGGYAYNKLEQSAREFRKLGIGILLISQVITDFNDAVKNNIDTKVQMKTNYEPDIKRVKDEYGKDYCQLVSKFTTGIGLLKNSKYNRGKPYFVHFRPLYHSQFKISESELAYLLGRSKIVLAKDHIKLTDKRRKIQKDNLKHIGVEEKEGIEQKEVSHGHIEIQDNRRGLLKIADEIVTKHPHLKLDGKHHPLKSIEKPIVKPHEKIHKKIDIETKFDTIIGAIKGDVTLLDLSKQLNIEKVVLEKDLALLAKHNILAIKYPFNIFSQPVVSPIKFNDDKKTINVVKGHGEVYDVTSDYVTARIEIIKGNGNNISTYVITLPEIGIGTRALLNELKGILVDNLDFLNEEIVDAQKFAELKERFIKESLVHIETFLPKEDISVKKSIAGLLLHQMYGLGDIDVMMADELLEEIVINNSKYPLVVYHKLNGWLRTTKFLDNEEQIFNLAAQIGRKSNRQINALHPIMDAQLFSGDRVAATLFPVSMMGHTITLRKFARSPWSIVMFLSKDRNMISYEMAAILWIATQYELNVLVIGGTAAGKTSVMNTLNVFIPHNQRVISIEDTKEIMLPRALHWNWVPLLSRNPNQDGQGGISMLDLMIASLRMRPDRIVVGEVRERKQVETMFEAMNTGHAVYATMHADTVEQLKRRLLEPPIEIPKNEVEALHLVLALHRDRRVGLRRALELAEIMQEGGTDLEINYLYRWHPRKDEFEQVNIPIRLYESLNLHTGMTIDEIQRDLDDKIGILKWMVKNELYDSARVEMVMELYYTDPQLLLKSIRENKEFSTVFKNV